MRERRLVYVAVAFEFLLEMMAEGFTILGANKTTKGLPKDAVFISSRFDEKTMAAYLLFEHESFEPVLIGSEIPIIDIHMTKYYDPGAERLLLERIKEHEQVVAA
jgi:hypothetical protein